MTSEPTDPRSEGATVVPLRAVDAQTEVRVDEDQAAAPAYVDLTSGAAPRKPVIPEHWRTREAARRHVSLALARHGHRAAYHGVRSPAYFVRALGFALWGAVVTLKRLVTWWHIPGATRLEWEAAASGLIGDHLRLHRQGRETRRARGTILALCLAALAAAMVAMVAYAPWWAWALFAAGLFAAFALAGRPQGKTITSRAELPAQVAPPTGDVIIRALGSIGVAEINKAIGANAFPPLPGPVREDGPGWRAEVDLPYGVTATQVIDRREQLASGLRRPLGAVWPEPVTHEHAGRLELWVGRADISKARPPAWPLLRGGQANIFEPQPFGIDVRGRVVKAAMAYLNMLIGSIPRQGKTAAVRLRACTYALDPIVELWTHELKGSGDLDPLEQVSHRFVSGIDDASIAYTAESLKLLKAEIQRRTERLRALPRELCPDKRVTREIGQRRSLKLWPIACIIDECQNLFSHERYGKQAAEDTVFIIKIGPAFGVMLDLATQRPDAKSLPTGVSSNVGLRFCLKVMDQTANDMVLGTSAYKNGIRATTFRADVDAGLGYLVGASSHPQVVRAYYLNLPDTERVAKRARALREAAGTLSGVALGQDDTAPQRDVLADVSEALGAATGMHWQPLADRLAERFPERWAEANGDAVRAELGARGVPSVVVVMDGQRARGCRAGDVEKAMSQ
ncbi:MAG: cell division protein FtsK [Streptosporangiaceae bacterium]